MSLFTSGPPELILRILQNCDTLPQLHALISTSRRLHSVWAETPGSVIWEVGKRSIVAFDAALMAVRATNIVKSAKANETSRFPSISELSGVKQKPTIAELNSVFSLQHMAYCMEQMILYWEKQPAGALFSTNPGPADPETLVAEGAEWQENLFRALYRVVIAGAVLSYAYNLPYLDPHSIATVGPEVPDSGDRLWYDYHRRFPVYNWDAEDESERGRWRNAEYKKTFGPLAEWIVETGRARGSRRGPWGAEDEDVAGETDDAAAVREIIRLLAAYEHLANKIVNSDEQRVNARPDLDLEPFERQVEGSQKTTTVILFGVFQVEDIAMPANAEDAASSYLIATRSRDINKMAEKQFDIDRSLYLRDADPLPLLQFFAFTLRKFFNFRFTSNAFEFDSEDLDPEDDSPFRSLATASLFCNGTWCAGLLEECSIVESGTEAQES